MKASLKSYPDRDVAHLEPQDQYLSGNDVHSEPVLISVPNGMKTLKDALAVATVVGDDISGILEYLMGLAYDRPMSSDELVAYIKKKFPEADALVARAAADQMESFLVQKFTEQAAPRLTLPEIGGNYALYDARGIDPELGRKENPVEFYQRVWGNYAEQGLLYQDLLTDRDPKIVQAVRSFCQKEKSRGGNPAYFDANSILPAPKSARTDPAELLVRLREQSRTRAALRRK